MKSLSKTIERAKRELEHMMDASPSVMLLVDGGGRILRSNRMLLDLVGVETFKDVLGKHLDEVFPVADGGLFDSLRTEGSDSASVEKDVMLAGVRRRLSFCVIGSPGHSDVSVVIADDVTGYREREEIAARQHKREAVEAVAGALLHNVNQPLTIIMARIQLLRMAIERGLSDTDELCRGVHDIAEPAMQIASILRSVSRPQDFVTEAYTEGVDILDIKKSTGNASAGGPFPIDGVDAILEVIEEHDPGGLDHGRRTGEYAAAIAREMGLPGERRQLMERCGRFHDIGKIAIPDAILQKPGGLTNEEMLVMKRHAGLGYELLRRFLLLEEADAAWAHHERHDGSGYPRGLSGSNIPETGRIVAVADVCDALCTGRLYHSAVSMEEARKKIEAGSGVQFDPEVVNAFTRAMKTPASRGKK